MYLLSSVQEPLESLITPAGFAPATYPPVHPSPSTSHSPSLQTQSQVTPHSQSQTQQLSAEDGKIVLHPPKLEVLSSDDNSAACVLPSDGVPNHPDLIDPGPNFTNTGTLYVCIYVYTYQGFI